MPNTLTAGQIEKLTSHGIHRVESGLYVQVKPNGAKSWVLRYRLNGRARMMGLGPVRLIGRTEALSRARRAQVQLVDGIDPIDTRRAERAPVVAAKAAPTFETVTATYLEAQADGWRNAKHRQQWENTLKTYAFPLLGKLPVDEVTVDHVLKVLKPIWSEKPETAGRLRGRIEKVLGAAEAAGHRSGPNPAAWQGGALSHLLPPLGKVQKVEHHAAVAYADVPALAKQIADRDGEAARALRFLILTAARSGEIRGATWAEIDLKEKTWTIPAERMKAGREHRVPLSAAALAVLPTKAGAPGALLFPGARKGGALSDMSISAVLRRMRVEGTVHGFRSSFRDWAAEKADAPREVAEACLAHAVGSAVELAYRRTDFFERRRDLMASWAEFVAGAS